MKSCACARCKAHDTCVDCEQVIDERATRYYVPFPILAGLFTTQPDTRGPICEACRAKYPAVMPQTHKEIA